MVTTSYQYAAFATLDSLITCDPKACKTDYDRGTGCTKA